jgi:hypothetical protein
MSTQSQQRQKLREQKASPKELDKLKTLEGVKCTTITSLDVMQQVCRKHLMVQFVYQNKPWEIEVFRLLPHEDAAIDQHLSGALPKMKEGTKPGEYVPDLADEAYIKKKAQLEIEGRSLAIYWGVPIFKKERPDMTSTAEITKFVQGYFNSGILNLLNAAVRSDGISIAEVVNFTSANPSIQS